MKKLIFATAAIAAMLAASCSNEDVQAPAAGGNVSFTVALPEMASRADFGDGTTAKKLTYYVYDAEATGDTKTVLFDGTATFGDDLHATVQLDLVTGKTYDIVFWADSYGDAATRPYTYDGATQTVTVTYGADANAEARDAFFFTEKALKVSGPVSKPVTLKRPFAQLNIGTSDFEAAEKAGLALTQTGMYIADMPNTLNLYDGTVGGSVKAEFTLAALPEGRDFPVEAAKYKYLTMNYVLVGADKTTVDVHLTSDINASADRKDMAFTAVPVQRNYRTNIFGALLTDPATFDVVISEGFDGAYNNGVLTVDVKPGEDLDQVLNTNRTAEQLTLNLGEGEYSYDSHFAGDLIITGVSPEKTIVRPAPQHGGTSASFSNLTLKTDDSVKEFYLDVEELTANDCVFDCVTPLYLKNKGIFKGCHFSGLEMGVALSAVNENVQLTFDDCSFEVKGHAENENHALVMLIGTGMYGDCGTYTFNKCSFKAIDAAPIIEGSTEIPAIMAMSNEAHNLYFNECKLESDFNKLYGIMPLGDDKVNVWVDGEQVVTAQP